MHTLDGLLGDIWVSTGTVEIVSESSGTSETEHQRNSTPGGHRLGNIGVRNIDLGVGSAGHGG